EEVFPADEQPSEVAEPRATPLPGSTLPLLLTPGEHRSSLPGSPPGGMPLWRNARRDPTPPVAPAASRYYPTPDAPRASWAAAEDAHADEVPSACRGLLRELDLRCVGAVQVEPQRQPVGVDDEHLCGPLPLPGEANRVAALLRWRERAVEEGHGPVELAALVERREGSPPDAF